MRLCEHEDFGALLVATADSRGLNEQFVEKDYYVTEVLRIVAATYGDRVIFKGGTSLSKGWQLIDRFSEDVDLFVDPARFVPALSGPRPIDRELRALRDAVAPHPALTLLPERGQTIGGRSRATTSPTPHGSPSLPAWRPPFASSQAFRAATTPSNNVRSARSSLSF